MKRTVCLLCAALAALTLTAALPGCDTVKETARQVQDGVNSTVDRVNTFELERDADTLNNAVKTFYAKVVSGELDLDAVAKMPDAEVIDTLSSLRGIGVWTAEMLLLFTLQRPDVLSYGDLGIHRGMRMVYRHRKITKKLFEKYRRRLSPCGSIASLYFWMVAGGAIPDLTDPAERTQK